MPQRRTLASYSSDDYHGERRNEIVFTGIHLHEQRVRSALDEALLTDAELSLGPDTWTAGIVDAVRVPEWERVGRRQGLSVGHQAAGQGGLEGFGAQSGADEDQFLALGGVRVAGAGGFEAGHGAGLRPQAGHSGAAG